MSNQELKMLKKFENGPLYQIEISKKTTGTDFHLSAHYDGDKNMAIGYGLDLYVNTWATIKKYLEDTNKMPLPHSILKRPIRYRRKSVIPFRLLWKNTKLSSKLFPTKKKGV